MQLACRVSSGNPSFKEAEKPDVRWFYYYNHYYNYWLHSCTSLPAMGLDRILTTTIYYNYSTKMDTGSGFESQIKNSR